MTEAGGVGKGINETNRDIVVNGSTLEIFLYWEGKGTTAIPGRGVYGPLISAITVKPNFSVSNGFSVGGIVGIVMASFAVLASVLVLLKMKGYLGGKDDEDNNEFRGLDTGYFSLRQIRAATNDFSPINKIGGGGFGPVYESVVPDVAVKQLSAKSKQGNHEFINEIGMISALQHPNLVKLHGCCIEGKELLLVYEYMVNKSLARSLFVQAPKVMQGGPTDELRFRAFERVSQDRVSEISMGSMHSDIQRRLMGWIDTSTSVQALDEPRETT
ncbi:putative LRR receptor-like serine/threonine-protein kinase [Drosera capensis]